MRWTTTLFFVLALSVMGCGQALGPVGGSGGDGGGGSGPCEGITCSDDGNECTVDGVCDPVDGMCRYAPVQDGAACGDGAGTCQAGSCVGTFDCSEQGILDAIDVGGGPHTFDCDGPTTVVTKATIDIYNNVILNGQGNLTVDGDDDHLVFRTGGPLGTVELRGFLITRGARSAATGTGVENAGGKLTLTNCTVSGNSGGSGVGNWGGEVTLIGSTVSGNEAGLFDGGGISNTAGALTLINSTVSENTTEGSGGGIVSWPFYSRRPTLTIVNSTIARNRAAQGSAVAAAFDASFANSVFDGDCTGTGVSNGYNIESPGNTCGLDSAGTDQVNVSADDLNLGELADNGGLTETHALLPGSPAINRIPAEDCEVTEDQRGEPQPEPGGDACDVGAFERQPDDPVP